MALQFSRISFFFLIKNLKHSSVLNDAFAELAESMGHGRNSLFPTSWGLLHSSQPGFVVARVCRFEVNIRLAYAVFQKLGSLTFPQMSWCFRELLSDSYFKRTLLKGERKLQSNFVFVHSEALTDLYVRLCSKYYRHHSVSDKMFSSKDFIAMTSYNSYEEM